MNELWEQNTVDYCLYSKVALQELSVLFANSMDS